MARRTGAIIMPLLMTLALVYLIWALLVHRLQALQNVEKGYQSIK